MKTKRDPDSIKDFDTIVSLFGYERDHAEIKNDPVYKKFNEWTKRIQYIGTNNNVPLGEILLLINYAFGYVWDTIPFGKYNEVYEFIKKNYDLRYKWIDPPLHEYLLKTNYYETSSTMVDKKATSIFCNNLYGMISAKRPKEEFLQMGIQILNQHNPNDLTFFN